METDAGRFVAQPDWWRNFHYRVEADRQQDHVESLFNPGWFHWDVDLAEHTKSKPATLQLAFGIEPIDWQTINAEDPRPAHLSRLIGHVEGKLKLPARPAKRKEDVRKLVAATDDFVVDRTVDGEPSTTILAGYPWFGDWGRDTMIALPGCLLVTGRHDEARATLRTFAAHVKDGLIPNRFDDYGGDPCYNTVGAPLWFVDAAMAYHDATGDDDTWQRDLMPACQQIVDRYATGTHYRIFMDRDGLISAGSPDTQLTWMDAMRDGVVFTPRYGKTVEVNGLWYNALLGLASRVNDAGAQRYRQLADRVRQSFMPTFWSDERGWLADHITTDGHTDWSLRPNQCIAAALPHSPIPAAKAKIMLKHVRDKLLTPMGMRTLPTDDPDYHGRHEGSMFERDKAYHQGTVWTWPTGPFVEAYLRAHSFSAAARKEAVKMLQPMLDEVSRHSLGSLHEIFDADPPHAPQGCPAQAWSVSEVLRAMALIYGRDG
jgi:predicted glycogen debranching enzyme